MAHWGNVRKPHFLVVITAISYSHSHTAGREQQLSFVMPHLTERSGTGMFSAPTNVSKAVVLRLCLPQWFCLFFVLFG